MKQPIDPYEQAEGILPMHEVFYIELIRYSSEKAIEARNNYVLVHLEKPDDHWHTVANIQQALSHAAELSRIFWPSKNKKNHIRELRGLKLRRSFQLADNSLLSNRKTRDALEHFDERLDEFLKEFPVGNLFPDAAVGDINTIPEMTRVFRFVDPEKSIFRILDLDYSFDGLFEEIFHVHELAITKIANGRL